MAESGWSCVREAGWRKHGVRPSRPFPKSRGKPVKVIGSGVSQVGLKRKFC